MFSILGYRVSELGLVRTSIYWGGLGFLYVTTWYTNSQVYQIIVSNKVVSYRFYISVLSFNITIYKIYLSKSTKGHWGVASLELSFTMQD